MSEIKDHFDWIENRSMKHSVIVKGKTITAETKEELERKLRRLKEFEEDDGA